MKTTSCPNCNAVNEFDEYDDHEFLDCSSCGDTFGVDETFDADGEIVYVSYFI
jgi:transcription elongation factor Elf1